MSDTAPRAEGPISGEVGKSVQEPDPPRRCRGGVLAYRAAAYLAFGAIALTACTSALPTPSASPSPVAAGPSREPPHLERLPREQAVVDALTAGGLVVTGIGGSKSEGQLGRVLPARVFLASPERNQAAIREGADVLFLPSGQWTIRVCERSSTEPGRLLYDIYLNGARVSGSDAPVRVYHFVGDGLFVIAYAERSADSLRRGLGLSSARC